MVALSDSFVRTAKNNIADCSNPIQLRGYLNQYKNYLMNDKVRELFKDRISFFRTHFIGDSLFQAQCEDLEDDLGIEIQIAEVCSNGLIQVYDNHPKLERSFKNDLNISFFEPTRYDHNCPLEEELLKNIFQMTNGNKMEIIRILHTSNLILNSKIDQYDLKGFLNDIRRAYRANIDTKFKDSAPSKNIRTL